MPKSQPLVADLIVACLEREGVTHVFGIPGEENIHLVDALSRSSIRFILVRHEQGASFMAETYGRLTGKAGVCSPPSGPGRSTCCSASQMPRRTPPRSIALSAQVGMNRSFKESHQGVDLVSMFAPVTKWSALVATPRRRARNDPEGVQTGPDRADRAPYTWPCPKTWRGPGARRRSTTRGERSSARRTVPGSGRRVPPPSSRRRRNPIVLAGHGAARAGAGPALMHFAETLGVPVATTFHGKGVFPDDHPQALGAIGFMRHDYVNFGFDQADVIVTVGYELQEFDPVRINPGGDKQIIHIHRFPAEVDRALQRGRRACSPISVTASTRWPAALDRHFETQTDEIADPRPAGRGVGPRRHGRQVPPGSGTGRGRHPGRHAARRHRAGGHRRAQNVDGPAVPEPMHPIPASSPMVFRQWPGRSRVPSARRSPDPTPGCSSPPATAGFLMNSQEIETALRERIPMVILIWVDDAYGLISWKMDLELGHHVDTTFGNPNFVAYAESFGATGYQITAPDQLLPTLQSALADDTVSVIACPVDYSANLEFIRSLGELDESFS